MSQVRAATYKEHCPKCNKTNYYDVGDAEDITGVDVEGLRCWFCGTEWLTEGSEDFTTLENANIEDGREAVN